MNRTRIVAWLRVILPLIALAMLSSLFLLSRNPESGSAVPFAPDDGTAGQTGMVAPDFAGVTRDGAQIQLKADSSTVGAGGGSVGEGEADHVRLTWRAKGGLAADVTAPQARFDSDRVMLSGGVRMTTSSGWVMTTPEISAALDRDLIDAGSQVNALAPFGTLTAGGMRITRQPDGEHLLDFTGGVRLLYEPQP